MGMTDESARPAGERFARSPRFSVTAAPRRAARIAALWRLWAALAVRQPASARLARPL